MLYRWTQFIIMMSYTTQFSTQSFTTHRGTEITTCKPCVGLVLQHNTSLMSHGHNYPRGYVVLETFNRKGTDIVNKATVAFITSANKESHTLTYDPIRKAILRMSASGNWKLEGGGGSDPYVSFGSLQLPWTPEEEKAHLEYSLGN